MAGAGVFLAFVAADDSGFFGLFVVVGLGVVVVAVVVAVVVVVVVVAVVLVEVGGVVVVARVDVDGLGRLDGTAEVVLVGAELLAGIGPVVDVEVADEDRALVRGVVCGCGWVVVGSG